MKDIMTVSTVTFNSVWGDKAANLNRILGYVEAAARQGSNLVVFPEMALTGYDDEEEKEKKDKMQYKEAEVVPGPSTEAVAELTKKYGIYAIFGMPERDQDNSDILYNSAAVVGPEGVIGSYRKIHLPYPEMHWAERGNDKPFILDTPWGKIGITICYDTYNFPENMRYEGAMGCRMHVNCTAYAKCHGDAAARSTVEAQCIMNGMYIVSSNLGGLDKYNWFWGGSSILGPSRYTSDVYYYAGHKFAEHDGCESEMFTATIDLSLAERFIFKSNPLIGGKTDYRPDKYIEYMQDILKNPDFGK